MKDKNTILQAYAKGQLSKTQLLLLEQWIETGEIQLEELEDWEPLHQQLTDLVQVSPSPSVKSRFYKKLARQNQRTALMINLRQWAAAAAILCLGIALGKWVFTPTPSAPQMDQLYAELTSMKELMALSLLEKESTSDRLKAVAMTQDMPTASDVITQALLKTLNQDENANVRLAALEALMPYAQQANIREGLIQSIAQQDSPLVQIALAEVMVALQEKRSVDALQKLMQKERIPDEIKDRINDKIEQLL